MQVGRFFFGFENTTKKWYIGCAMVSYCGKRRRLTPEREDGKLHRLVETGERQIASVRRNGRTAYCIEPFGRADGVLYKSAETCGRYIDIGLPQ